MSIDKFLFTIFIFFLTYQSYAQPSDDSTDFRIASLNWVSFGLTPTYYPMLVLSEEAKRLVDHPTDSSQLFKKLIKAFDNEEKVVATHIILTRLFQPTGVVFEWTYGYAGNKIVYTNYTYNHLIWQFSTTFSIKGKDILAIRNYWTDKFEQFQKHKN